MTAPQASSRALESVLDNLDREEPAALDRLFRLLAIPSISTDPAFHEACIEAAEACADALRDIGFEARVEPTLGKPMVVGHRHAPPERRERPRVLFYGHYDVQPPDPLPEWKAPPFEPRLVNDPRHGKIIVARGSSDDKGQLMTFIEACRAWLEEHGRLPLDVTVLIEGEENQAALASSPSSRPTAMSSGPTSRLFATRANGMPIRRLLPPFCAVSPFPKSPSAVPRETCIQASMAARL
jgi:acetylornithine deacetylase/succinyl-diaminopimelate desuccinylase-like protein